MSETNAEKIVFKRPDSLLPVITNYCPGCPHGIVNRLVAEVIDELGIEGKTVGVASVGCSVFTYNYTRVSEKLYCLVVRFQSENEFNIE